MDPLAPIYLLQDNPRESLDHDFLGIEPWARMVAGTAVHTPGPFTVGVYREWGYGKTTLLHMARCLVDDYQETKPSTAFVTVWFNAWQFERESHPLFPLIAAITDEIEHKLDTESGLAEAAKKKLKKVGLSLRALTRGMKFKADVGVPLIGKVGVEFEAQKALDAEELLGRQADPLQQELLYHGAFKLLKQATSSVGDMKIVVFVDDLDRCDPEKALFLLESIKLVLAQQGFVFVLAVDKDVIETYLDKVYRDVYGFVENGKGRHYMEKLVQLPLHIPPHDSRFSSFMDKIIDELSEKYKAHDFKVDALKNVSRVLATGARSNPRRVVRLVNSFLIDAHLWQETSDARSKDKSLTSKVANALAAHRILTEALGEDVVDLIATDEETVKELLDGTFGGH